jgi:transposase, IS30 family
MGRRGPGALPQVEKREQYARLIAQGYNNSEACRIVGINRRTGKRWRHGRTITARDVSIHGVFERHAGVAWCLNL